MQSFLQNLRGQTLFPELEVVLVLNEPSLAEKRISTDFQIKYPQQAKILQVGKVETLGASWNRAWAAAKGPYLAMWNIDERRLPDSLSRQLSAIEQNPEWVLCYGDYLAVAEYGAERGKLRRTPKYRAGHFSRSFVQGGAFWVFRNDVEKQIGYFDEQFEVGPDMELSFRMAAAGLQMGKCEGVLGYFTDAGQGLSTRDGAKRSSVERTAIQLRYGVFDKVRAQFVKEASKIHLDTIMTFGEWHPLSEYLPEYKTYLRRRRSLKVLGGLRNLLRGILGALGLLRPLYRLQEKLWQREI